MLRIEIKFPIHGRELSPDSIVEAIAREVCDAIHKILNQSPSRSEPRPIERSQETGFEVPPQAVSIWEVARLLSVSPRTIHNYIALKLAGRYVLSGGS